MITWTTPTIIVYVRNADLVSTGCHVLVTIAQDDVSVTVSDPPMSYDSESDTTILVGLSQEQSGQLHKGLARLQVNARDWMGFRPASDQAPVMLGSNFVKEVI